MFVFRQHRSAADTRPVERIVNVSQEDLEPFLRQADHNLQQYVSLIVEPDSKLDLVELLNACTIAKTSFVDSEGNIVILADTNGYGEAAHCITH